MEKIIDFFEDSNGGLYVTINVNDKCIYSASGLENIKDNKPSNYMSWTEKEEETWERGNYEQQENAPTNEEVFDHLSAINSRITNKINHVASYTIDTKIPNKVIDCRVCLPMMGSAAEDFFGREDRPEEFRELFVSQLLEQYKRISGFDDNDYHIDVSILSDFSIVGGDIHTGCNSWSSFSRYHDNIIANTSIHPLNLKVLDESYTPYNDYDYESTEIAAMSAYFDKIFDSLREGNDIEQSECEIIINW